MSLWQDLRAELALLCQRVASYLLPMYVIKFLLKHNIFGLIFSLKSYLINVADLLKTKNFLMPHSVPENKILFKKSNLWLNNKKQEIMYKIKNITWNLSYILCFIHVLRFLLFIHNLSWCQKKQGLKQGTIWGFFIKVLETLKLNQWTS